MEFETDKWKVLYIKKEENLLGVYYLFEIPSENKHVVLLPFLFLNTRNDKNTSTVRATSSELDRLVKWILPRLEKVRKKYDELIGYIDNDVMKDSPFWDVWKEARGIED